MKLKKHILKNFISIFTFVLAIFLVINTDFFYEVYTKLDSSFRNIIIKHSNIDFTDKLDDDIKNVKYVWNEEIVDDSYFEDALFIGDSRLLFFSHHKFLRGAIWYCKESFGVFDGIDVPMWIDFVGKKSIKDLLLEHNFGKIYINLGINYLDKDINLHKEAFENFINEIRLYNPNSIIYILSNIHMTKEKQKKPFLTNERIDEVNDFLKSFESDNIFYIDITSIYDDSEHNLKSEYSYDGLHIYEKYYDELYNILVRGTVTSF